MKILIIRFLQIGDVLMTSVICNALKSSFPDSQVDYLMHESSTSLFENHPHIDNVIGLSKRERKNPFKYLRKIFRLSRNNYDIIVDASSTSKSELVSLLSTKAQYKIGRFKKGRGFGYTHRIPKDLLSGNKVEQRLKLLQPLIDAGMAIALDTQLRLYPTTQERTEMRAQMSAHGVDFSKPVYAFAVSAREREKNWDPAQMQMLVQHCIDIYQAQIVLFSGLPHEQLMIDKLYKALISHKKSNEKYLFNRIPCPSLRSLLPLFSHCDLFVGNEGGPRHLAQSVGTPSVSVFSPAADFDEWFIGDSDRHQGIAWSHIPGNKDKTNIKFEYGDDTYFSLYNTIQVDDVIPLVDEAVKKHVRH